MPWPSPTLAGDKPGEPLNPRPTGDAVFNYPSSMLGAPVATIPMMAVVRLPVGYRSWDNLVRTSGSQPLRGGFMNPYRQA